MALVIINGKLVEVASKTSSDEKEKETDAILDLINAENQKQEDGK